MWRGTAAINAALAEFAGTSRTPTETTSTKRIQRALRVLRVLGSFVVGLAATAGVARAEVTRVEIATRVNLGTSGYEKIVGTIHFAVDPRHPRNRVVADLDKAPL